MSGNDGLSVEPYKEYWDGTSGRSARWKTVRRTDRRYFLRFSDSQIGRDESLIKKLEVNNVVEG